MNHNALRGKMLIVLNGQCYGNRNFAENEFVVVRMLSNKHFFVI